MSLRAALLLLMFLPCPAVLAQGRGAAQAAPPTTPATAPQTAPQAAPPAVPPAAPAAAPAAKSGRSSQDTIAPQDTSVPSPQQVLARRLSDVVAVRDGPRSPERVLYYFNSTATLVEGGHLEQGSGGHSEIALEGGGIVALHANGHVELIRLAAEGDVIKLPVVTRLEVRAGVRPLELQLPGDTIVHLVKDDLLIVTLEPGRLRIRNQGDVPINVFGDLRLSRQSGDTPNTGELSVKAGEEVLMPLFAVAGFEEGTVTDLWGWLVVRHTAGSTVTMNGDQLTVVRDPASSEPTEALEVRGVYTLASGGDQLVIHDPLHVERPPEPAPEPAAVPPAAEPTPAETPATVPPAEPEQPAATPETSPPATPPDTGGEPPKPGSAHRQEKRS